MRGKNKQQSHEIVYTINKMRECVERWVCAPNSKSILKIQTRCEHWRTHAEHAISQDVSASLRYLAIAWLDARISTCMRLKLQAGKCLNT